MSSPRTIVLVRQADSGRTSASDSPGAALGSREGVKDELARFNTHPDGARNTVALGMERLYGPGFVVELPTSVDEVAQVLVSINDDETAWPVLSRICRTKGWKMIDPDTGRVFM